MSASVAENLRSKSKRIFRGRAKTALKKKRALINVVPAKTEDDGFVLPLAEREKLVVENRIKARKLARSILRRWHARMDLEEVDSIVDLSLCEAVKRYNPEKGASFITFFFYHLRGNLIRAVSSAVSQNSEGNTAEDLNSYRSVNSQEIAEALSGSEAQQPDDVLFKKELVSLGLQACAKLDQLERQVIERIYLGEEQLLDIAKSLGYSRCHISRVKRKALEALLSNMQEMGGDAIPTEVTFQDEEPAKRKAPRVKALSRRKLRSKTDLQLIKAA